MDIPRFIPVLLAVISAAMAEEISEKHLLARWSFNHDGISCLKEDINNLHLVPRGPLPKAGFTKGVFGLALELKAGSRGQYISKDPALTGLTPPFTIACWIRRTTPEPKQSIIAATAADGAPHGYELSWSWRKLLFRCGLGRGTKAFTLVTPGYMLQLNTWHHVAVSCGTDKAALYIDGFKVIEKSFPERKHFVSSTGQGTAFSIGHFPSSFSAYQHIGLFDEMRIYTKALTEDELSRLPPLHQ